MHLALCATVCDKYYSLMEVTPTLLDFLLDRVNARPSGLQSIELSETAELQTVKSEVQPDPTEQADCLSDTKNETHSRGCEAFASENSPELKVSGYENVSLTGINSGVKIEHSKDVDIIDGSNESFCNGVESSYMHDSEAVKDLDEIDMDEPNTCSSVLEEISVCTEEQDDRDMAKSSPSPLLPNGFSCFDKDSSVSVDYQDTKEDLDLKHVDVIKCMVTANGFANYSNGYASANKCDVPVEDGDASFSNETPSAEMHQLKWRVASENSEADKGNGVKKVEKSGTRS